MRVPHSVVGRTRPSQEGLQYLRADTSGVVSAFSNVFRGVAGIGDALLARQDKTDRFDALQKFSQFETDVDAQITELQRNTVPGDREYLKKAEETYTKLEGQFVSTLSPELQDEYRARAAQVKQRVAGVSLDFNYKQQDLFYRQGIATTVDGAKKSLAERSTPEDLKLWLARTNETIDATDLSDVEKTKVKQDASIALASIAYKNALKEEKLKQPKINVGEGDQATKSAAVLRHFEGLRLTPYNDAGSLRIGYGSDTITLADGTVKRVVAGMRITREDAERDLARRIPAFQANAIKEIGAKAWNALSDNAKAALTSVTYNYGTPPASVVAAAKTGDMKALAVAVGQLSANRSRRREEAQLIAGDTAAELLVNSDPQFSAVPYEDRIALAKDADTEVSSYLSEQSKLAKAARDAEVNELLNRIKDGVSGQADIDNYYQNNPSMDYDTRTKLDEALKKKQGDVANLSNATAKLNSNSIWDPTSADDKKMLNVLVGEDGLQKLGSADKAYFANGIVPLVQKTQDIPTDVAGLLSGMARNRNPALANYALDALSQLREIAPSAFDDRTGDDLASNVEFFNKMKNILPPEELLSAVRGGLTSAERQSKLVLRDEAERTLTNKQDPNFIDFKTVLEQFNYVGFLRGRAELSAIPWVSRGLERDFQTHYINEYVRYGDGELAKEAAVKSMQRDWGISNLGGQNVVMKYPPEKAGYRYGLGPVPDEEIDKQVRERYGLGPEDKYQLLSDELTESDVALNRAGQLDRPVTYSVVTFDEAGVPRVNREQRISFIQTPEFKAKTEADFDVKVAEEDYNKWLIGVYLRAKEDASLQGTEVPMELEAERKVRETELGKVKEKLNSFKVPSK